MLDRNKKVCIFAPAFDGEERQRQRESGAKFFERIEAKVWKVRYKSTFNSSKQEARIQTKMSRAEPEEKEKKERTIYNEEFDPGSG